MEQFGQSGAHPLVTVAMEGKLMVVACEPGWDEQDWDQALAPFFWTEAYLIAMDDGDDCEIYVFEMQQEAAA